MIYPLTSKAAVSILVWPAQIKTSCSEMIKLINKGILVYLFGSFSFFQDNSQSLLSYIVAYYLRHFDEVCFGSCLFESLFCFSLICLEILPELSFHLLSCQRIPWLILYQIIYFPFSHLQQKQISLSLFRSLFLPPHPPPLSLFPALLYFSSCLSLFISSSYSALVWLHSNLQSVHWHSIQSSASVNN